MCAILSQCNSYFKCKRRALGHLTSPEALRHLSMSALPSSVEPSKMSCLTRYSLILPRISSTPQIPSCLISGESPTIQSVKRMLSYSVRPRYDLFVSADINIQQIWHFG